MLNPSKKSLTLLPLAFCLSASVQAAEITSGKELWLFGGGEPICSSVELKRCAPDKQAEAAAYFQQHQGVTQKTFKPDTKRIAELTALPHWPEKAARALQVKPLLLTKLEQMQNKDWPEDSWYS